MSMDDIQLVSVFESGDPLELEVLKAMLESEGISSSIHGSRVPDLFGWGRIGTGYNIAIGAARLVVDKSDFDSAVALIRKKHLDRPTAIDIPEEEWNTSVAGVHGWQTRIPDSAPLAFQEGSSTSGNRP